MSTPAKLKMSLLPNRRSVRIRDSGTNSAAPTEAPSTQTRQAASSTMGDSPPGSSPLSSTKTPPPSPVKQSDQSGDDNSPVAKPKISLKLNLSKKPSPAADAAETDQLPKKRKRAAQANKKSKLNPASKISAPSLRLDMSNNPPPADDAAETDQLPAKRGRAVTAAQANKKPRLTAAPKNSAPKIVPTMPFTDGAVVAYDLRQIYDAIPKLPKEKLQMIWVSIEKRREVFELVQKLPEFRKATLKVDCARQLHAIKLDLNIWDDGVSNLEKVRYPFFEHVLEKILFYIERSKPYEVEQQSLVKYEEAKAVQNARNNEAEEDYFRDTEVREILDDLKAVEEQYRDELKAVEEQGRRAMPHGDSTHYHVRSRILNIATRFGTEQSRMGLDCSKLIEHLRADLHLYPADSQAMKAGTLPTLSSAEILAISSKLPAWIEGQQIYEAGQRTHDMFADTWYEEYSAVHSDMSKLGLFVYTE